MDLQFLPGWLKETDGKNPYAHFRGDEGENNPRERRGRPSDRPRGPKTDAFRKRDGDSARPHSGQKKHRSEQRHQPGGTQRREDRPPVQPANVVVEFGPDPKCLQNVAAEIKSTHHAYAVFNLARMFLQQPERYTVKITSKDGPLYRLGPDGPVSTTVELLERGAFSMFQDQFYTKTVTATDPPKGNFSSVARCKLSGTLLGPTSYHAYQPAVRSLYEKRFSKRMSFAEYTARNIENISDPAVVEEWKSQVSQTTTWSTVNSEPAITFTSSAAVQAHFKSEHFPRLLQEVQSVELTGPASLKIKDQSLANAIRDAWYRETKFPGHLVGQLTSGLASAGLHLFKHRKRFLYVSSCRPQLFTGDAGAVRDTVTRILSLLQATPGLNRKDLAAQLLPAEATAEDLQKMRIDLASDLHWMIAAGHIIEFQDGKLDLPLAPKAQSQQPDQ